MANDPAGDRVLRAKYLDWCSAQVADRFLELSPDQIYELAHGRSGVEPGTPNPAPGIVPPGEMTAAAAGSAVTPAALSNPLAAAGVEGGAVYFALVARVAESLAATLRLPPFEEWAAAYCESPASFDEELLGLWRGGVP
jgi:hypothetical protein